MRTELSRLVKDSVTYGAGSLLSKLVAFLLLPVYTRMLSPADYGVLSLLNVTLAIVNVVIRLGVGSAIFREVIYRGTDENAVISTSLYFLLFESAAVLTVLAGFSEQFSRLIFGKADYNGLLRLIFLCATLETIGMVLAAKLRVHRKAVLFAVLAFGKFLSTAGLNIVFVVVFKRGVHGIIIATTICTVIFAVIDLLLLLPTLRLTFNSAVLKRMLVFGIPLIPFGLSRTAMTFADRYILNYYWDTAQVGLYSLGYNVGLIVNLLVQAIQLAWPAQMFAISKKPDAPRRLGRMLTYYFLIVGFVGLSISVLGVDILRVMTTPRFYPAHKVIPYIVLSYVLYGVVFMVNSGLETRNKMKYMSATIGVSAVINTGLNFVLIPRYGAMGAAYATVASYIVLAVLQVVVNRAFWPIPYEYARIAKIVAAVGVVYAASTFISIGNLALSILVKGLLLLAYPFLLAAFKFYLLEEKEAVRKEIVRIIGLARGGRTK